MTAGKKLTGDGKYGLAVEGGEPVENSHHAFIFGKQHGADFFDASGKPDVRLAAERSRPSSSTSTSWPSDKIAAPGNAEYAQNQSISDFATGKAAHAAVAGRRRPAQVARHEARRVRRRARCRADAPAPASRAPTRMVAGINLAVFKNTDNIDGALKFVKFMTSDEEQQTLNAAYGSHPAGEGGPGATRRSTPPS